MIRVAVIGAGRWGPNFVRNLQNPPASEVLWVVDPDKSRLAQVAERIPAISVTDKPETPFKDEAVDAVVIASPINTHFELARAALESRKHVLVEKPLTDKVADAEALCEIADAAGRVLMAGHTFVYNPGIRAVKDYIDSGELGRVHYISMVRTNLGPVRSDTNAAWDLAPHDVSIADYWLGGSALAVSAMGGSFINKGIEDVVFATLRFPRNVLVNINVSWLNPRKIRHITVVGEKKMLTFDDMDLNEPIRLYDKRVAGDPRQVPYVDTFASFRESIQEGEITIPHVPSAEPLKLECDHFIECLELSRPPLTGGMEGLRVVKTLDAIDRSLRSAGLEQEVE